VNVRIEGDAFTLDGARRGDSADMLLDYVGYKADELRAAYREKLAAAGLEGDAGKRLESALEAGLTGYTYLRETRAGFGGRPWPEGRGDYRGAAD